MSALQALLGLGLIHAALFCFSEDRRAVPWRLVLTALAAQFLLAVTLTAWPGALVLFDLLNRLMQALQSATDAGTAFLFGYLAGAPAPFVVSEPGAGYILALRALPVIIVMSALARVLTHWGVLPLLVRALSRVLERSFGIGGALGLAAAANLFVGMIEAPLLVRPYLERMSRGELFALMGCGMATIAGTVFVLFSNILAPVVPNAAGHLLTASLMSLPAAIAFCVMLIPPAHHTEASERVVSADASTFDAITTGTADGLRLYFNILAMLLVLVALVHLLNSGLGLVVVGGEPLTLERMLGWLLAPLCWLLGIPAAEALEAGRLLGTKVVLNEVIAYVELARLDADVLSDQSRIIMTYALCGFANFGSMGMLAGALSVMLPARRREVLDLGLRSVAVGTLATCSTGAVIGLVT